MRKRMRKKSEDVRKNMGKNGSAKKRKTVFSGNLRSGCALRKAGVGGSNPLFSTSIHAAFRKMTEIPEKPCA